MTDPHHNSYQLLDSGDFRKLEQVGPVRIIRPAAGAVWKASRPDSLWKSADAEFIRSRNGEGRWTFFKKNLPKTWDICSDERIMLRLRFTDFGHIGIFPEHHDGGDIRQAIQQVTARGETFRLLNLFAYTGATSLLAAEAGADVVHVDASKTSVQWARENAGLNPAIRTGIRWITEDVRKFIAREIRRKSVYQGLILDPPSFGRGTRSEVWKIEEDLPPLLESLRELCGKDLSLIRLSAHSPGLTPLTLENLLRQNFSLPHAHFDCHEMLLQGNSDTMNLPSGACAIMRRKAGT